MKKRDKFTLKQFSKIKAKFVSKGKTVRVKRAKEGHFPEITEFNFAIVKFCHLFDCVKDKALPFSQRMTKSTKDFRVLAFEKPEVFKPALKTITELANLPGKPYRDPQKRFLYQEALGKVYSMLVQESWQAGIKETLGFLLERGSLLVGAFYNYPPGHLARIVAKRLDYASGAFGLGLSYLRLPKNIKRFKKLHIQEDCVATGDSIAGTILALKKKGIVFNEIQIDAAVVTQTGVEFLQKYLKYLGVKRVGFKIGALCFKLDKHYYLKRTKEEGYRHDEFFVGDMGEWSRILPKSFDKVAWWNKNRIDYTL